jgi:hypothetical protein
MNIRVAVLFAAIFAFGFTLNAAAQSRAERRKAREMERIEKKSDRKAKRRPEETSAAHATYGNQTAMRGYKMPSKGPRKKLNIHRPAKGTASNSMQSRGRRKNS